MKVNSYSPFSFKSTPLYDVKVQKRGLLGYKSINATFCALDPNDINDIERATKMGDECGYSSIGYEISDHFEKNECEDAHFYALEVEDKKTFKKKLISLCEITIPWCNDAKKYYVDLLQSISGGRLHHKKRYKGVGEVTLYGVVKDAKRNGMDEVRLTSTYRAKPFYDHIGFKPAKDFDEYFLASDSYNRFISRVERKYDFKA